ncbi:hypothetical protein GQ43DRAFT_35861 [Delitschia confertaspora ATCC 74209]|uniref:Uncharacterized protein n=1 Tax=Delitschia confertaspora ATCC 74209 TaxID=1513339 RepID=A0A9P4MZH8_9PLEO|nr:hypothetical protein GQ43DRAFT_35861 [Delitschia confertaspora ATCC 74209]
MPRYNSLGTTVRLTVAKLADTITSDVKRQKCDAATANVEKAEGALKSGRILSEKTVPFPGTDDGLLVNFIGKYGNTPFMMVQAGTELFRAADNVGAPVKREQRGGLRKGSMGSTATVGIGKPSPATTHSINPLQDVNEVPETKMAGQAIGLNVILSEKSFIHCYGSNGRMDVKIEVFFNGTLASSTLASARDATGRLKSLHHIFAGNRTGWLFEQPWVILPLGQNVDGSLRQYERAGGPRERWQQLSEALLREADTKGFDNYGDRPPSGDYLACLAKMHIPALVDGLQNPSGRGFGVIDVVLSTGRGDKLMGAHPYIKQPTPLKDERYKPRREDEEDGELPQKAVSEDGGSEDEDVLAGSDTTMEGCTSVSTPVLTEDSYTHYPDSKGETGFTRLRQSTGPFSSLWTLPKETGSEQTSSQSHTGLNQRLGTNPIIPPLPFKTPGPPASALSQPRPGNPPSTTGAAGKRRRRQCSSPKSLGSSSKKARVRIEGDVALSTPVKHENYSINTNIPQLKVHPLQPHPTSTISPLQSLLIKHIHITLAHRPIIDRTLTIPRLLSRKPIFLAPRRSGRVKRALSETPEPDTLTTPPRSSLGLGRRGNMQTGVAGRFAGKEESLASGLEALRLGNREESNVNDGAVFQTGRFAASKQHTMRAAKKDTGDVAMPDASRFPLPASFSLLSTSAHAPPSPSKPNLNRTPKDSLSLCTDSVLSLAQETSRNLSGASGKPVLRQVRSERPGVFREDEVLFGVRFIIAG